jgi:hypothetical protein
MLLLLAARAASSQRAVTQFNLQTRQGGCCVRKALLDLERVDLNALDLCCAGSDFIPKKIVGVLVFGRFFTLLFDQL